VAASGEPWLTRSFTGPAAIRQRSRPGHAVAPGVQGVKPVTWDASDPWRSVSIQASGVRGSVATTAHKVTCRWLEERTHRRIRS
jgi:hypothetical protein